MNLWTTIAWAMLTAAGVMVAWAVLSDPAHGRLRCPGGWRRLLRLIPIRQGCWYDMGGVATPDAPEPHTCPECGRLHPTRALRRRRVRWRGIVLALLLVLGAYPTAVWNRMSRHGVWAGVPTWTLVAFAPVEEYCRGALGCPFSWAAMSPPSRELMMPRWDRPYAAWEAAILQRRLERTTARVRADFPGRDVAYVVLAPQDRSLALVRDGTPELLRSAHVDQRAGLVVIWGESEGVAAWRKFLSGAGSLPVMGSSEPAPR